MAIKDNLMAAGGFRGELICKVNTGLAFPSYLFVVIVGIQVYHFVFLLLQHLNQPCVAFCTKITTDENAITNAVDMCYSPK